MEKPSGTISFLWNIFVFRLVEYLLNLYKFDTVLYQFLGTGTSDRSFMGRDQELKFLSFTVPLLF